MSTNTGNVVDFGPANIVGVGDVILIHNGVYKLTPATVITAGTNKCVAEYTELHGVKAKTITTVVRYSIEPWPGTWSQVASRAQPKFASATTVSELPKQYVSGVATGTVTITKVVLGTPPALSMEDVINLAKTIAKAIAKKKGHVTSTDVFNELHARKIPLKGHDPRWMGQVFSTRTGWKRIRYARVGSHRRPVSVWKRK